MAIGLARRGHRVFWISPSRFVSPASEEPYEPAQLRENLWEIITVVSRSTSTAARYLLHGSAFSSRPPTKDLDLLRPALYSIPFWPDRLALHGRGTKLIFDCMDNWRNCPSEPSPAPAAIGDQASSTAAISSSSLRAIATPLRRGRRRDHSERGFIFMG
jgi:hypothetical protein